MTAAEIFTCLKQNVSPKTLIDEPSVYFVHNCVHMQPFCYVYLIFFLHFLCLQVASRIVDLYLRSQNSKELTGIPCSFSNKVTN